MSTYRLNKTSPAIRKLIVDYLKEKGVPYNHYIDSDFYIYPMIRDGVLDSCTKEHLSAIPIGIDEFLKKIDDIAAKPKAVKISPLSDHPTTIESNGDLKVGCTTIPQKEVKRFIKEYTKQILPEKEFYVGGDFFMNENEDIYMLVYSSGYAVQLVALNGGNRYTDPISNHGSGMHKDHLLKLSGGRPLVHIKNPYQ